MILQACLNGGRARSEHPRVPLAADEIARDAAAAVAAGADAIHAHPRAGDAQTLDPAACDAVVLAVRAACPGVPLGLTTTAAAERDPERRIAVVAGWRVLPDYVSVNLHEQGGDELLALLDRRELAVEAGVWTPEAAERCVSSGRAGRCLRILVEATEQDAAAALATVDAILSVLRAAKIATPLIVHGEGRAAWPVLEHALAGGHGVRIGLEDALHRPDGAPATDNAELVGIAARYWERARRSRSSGPAMP